MDRSAGRSPRGDASEVPVDRVAVPKTGQKNASPRENATEMLVGRGSRAEDRAEDLSKNRQLTRTGGVSGEALPVDVLDDQTGKSHPENGGDVSQGTVDLSLFRNLVRDNLLLVV